MTIVDAIEIPDFFLPVAVFRGFGSGFQTTGWYVSSMATFDLRVLGNDCSNQSHSNQQTDSESSHDLLKIQPGALTHNRLSLGENTNEKQQQQQNR